MLNSNAPSFEFSQGNSLSLQAKPFQHFSQNKQAIQSQYSYGGYANQGYQHTAGQKSERNGLQQQPTFLTPQRQQGMPKLMQQEQFSDLNVGMNNGAIFSSQSKPYMPRQSTEINQSPFYQVPLTGNHMCNQTKQKSCYDFGQSANMNSTNEKQLIEVTSDHGHQSNVSTRYSTSSDSDESNEELQNVQAPAIAKTQSVNASTFTPAAAPLIQQQQGIQLQSHQSTALPTTCTKQHSSLCNHQKVAVEGEGEWKSKIKTELCKYWLKGQQCENLLKDQGCGFAHGEEELQPKKGLNKQYLTSVCKNFIDSPEKCTYGHRCIFQHPTLDVYERQTYRDMMEDNVRYTAMRMFQNIEGAETLYINTYALKTPRLSIFKQITQGAKRDGFDAE